MDCTDLFRYLYETAMKVDSLESTRNTLWDFSVESHRIVEYINDCNVDEIYIYFRKYGVDVYLDEIEIFSIITIKVTKNDSKLPGRDFIVVSY